MTGYVPRRDPDFDQKMVQALNVYEQMEFDFDAKGRPTIRLSYDEKPGLQAFGNTAPDQESVRHDTVSLLAGLDLATSELMGLVRPRHRRADFGQFLKALDAKYPTDVKIPVVLDHHSAHTSKETRAYRATVPNRCDFVFTRKHASWLNLIEIFFVKLSKQVLRRIRVQSREALTQRILDYLDGLNQDPVRFRWKWKPEHAKDMDGI